MIDRYTEQLRELPKGTVSTKTVGDKTYYYLKYRDGKKVVSVYLKRDTASTVKTELEKRKHIKSMLKALEEERLMAAKILEERV